MIPSIDGRFSGKNSVHEQGKEDQGNGDEASVPSLRNIVRVVEHNQPLNLGTGHIATCGGASLPSEYTEPAKLSVNDEPRVVGVSTTDQSYSWCSSARLEVQTIEILMSSVSDTEKWIFTSETQWYCPPAVGALFSTSADDRFGVGAVGHGSHFCH